MISWTMFAPLEVLVLPADLGRVIEEADVRHRIGDDRLGARLHQHRDVPVGVEPRQERIVPVGDVHVDDGAAVGRRVPGRGAGKPVASACSARSIDPVDCRQRHVTGKVMPPGCLKQRARELGPFCCPATLSFSGQLSKR